VLQQGVLLPVLLLLLPGSLQQRVQLQGSLLLRAQLREALQDAGLHAHHHCSAPPTPPCGTKGAAGRSRQG
jgi:hypothetical protein